MKREWRTLTLNQNDRKIKWNPHLLNTGQAKFQFTNRLQRVWKKAWSFFDSNSRSKICQISSTEWTWLCNILSWRQKAITSRQDQTRYKWLHQVHICPEQMIGIWGAVQAGDWRAILTDLDVLNGDVKKSRRERKADEKESEKSGWWQFFFWLINKCKVMRSYSNLQKTKNQYDLSIIIVLSSLIVQESIFVTVILEILIEKFENSQQKC